jgi:phage shock protein PspC (stress-responsive transcriptional regulator)
LEGVAVRFLLDPRLFNVLVMTLSAFAAIRWTVEGSWKQSVYWAAAFALTFAITYLPD